MTVLDFLNHTDEFSWKNINIEVKSSNIHNKDSRIKILSDISGIAQPGLLAIMGASGSGKTTLLKAFAGQIPDGAHTTGQIFFNQEGRKSNWLDILGFGGHDDTLYEQLTAYETVRYAALFKLKNRIGNIHSKIMELFDKLGIAHIASNEMRSLSGGERKRILIAIELITDPKIIFLDEPTSGLDNNSAFKLIRFLKSIANEGKIVIFSIHQPDDITANEFDQILLLSRGRSIYMGKYSDCETLLNNNGYFKLRLESFSNFMMHVLDTSRDIELKEIAITHNENKREQFCGNIEEDNGHSHQLFTSESTNAVLDSERQAIKHKITYKKITKNEHFVSLRLKLEHISLLMRRKTRLYFSNKQNIVSFILNVLLSIVFC